MNSTAFNVVYLTFWFHFVSMRLLKLCFLALMRGCFGLGNKSKNDFIILVLISNFTSRLKGVVQDFIISFDEEHTDIFLAL